MDAGTVPAGRVGMELAEIKTAVLAGETVHWASSAYVVTHAGDDADRGFCIVCTFNDSAIGLTWRDGVTMNGDVEDFYMAGVDRSGSAGPLERMAARR
jgi:hypothetical protein